MLFHVKINDDKVSWMREADFLHYLSSIVNLNHRQMIASAGAVLSFLTRNQWNENKIHSQDAKINGIEQFNVGTFMHANKDTIMSLQIFYDQVQYVLII